MVKGRNHIKDCKCNFCKCVIKNPGKKKGSRTWNKGIDNRLGFNCIGCNTKFKSYSKIRKYCSTSCASKYKPRTEKHRKGISKALIGNKNGENGRGRIVTIEQRNQISKTLKQLYKDEPERIENLKEYRKNQKRVYISKHEKLFKKYLEKNNIKFKPQKFISNIKNMFRCDFFVYPNIVVEIDGEYWHNLSENKKRDEIRTKQMIEKGYIVIRVESSEIYNSNYKEQTNKINNRISQIKNAI